MCLSRSESTRFRGCSDRRKEKAHLIVSHNYHDHASDSPLPHGNVDESHNGTFPMKLHAMLSLAEENGSTDIVFWQPHGRCFVVHKPKAFQREILPSAFKLTKMSSFLRQLNIYGFLRLTKGKDAGGYYHERFLRGKEFLAHDIKRTTIKGTGVRAKSNPAEEPLFWNMPWVSAERKQGSSEPNSNSVPSPTPNHCGGGDITPLAVASSHESATIAKSESVNPDLATSNDIGPPSNALLHMWGRPFHYIPNPSLPLGSSYVHVTDQNRLARRVTRPLPGDKSLADDDGQGVNRQDQDSESSPEVYEV